VVLREGRSVKPPELIEKCQERLPKFMIPRYLEFVSALPKTASEKIQKVSLKSRGIGAAWDRLEEESWIKSR
jgi:carnitine-CoA ligase